MNLIILTAMCQTVVYGLGLMGKHMETCTRCTLAAMQKVGGMGSSSVTSPSISLWLHTQFNDI